MTEILEILGTASFAISGAAAAMERRLDLFGILFTALLTATGGGVLRDVILGNTPPMTFQNPTYLVLAFFCGLIAVTGGWWKEDFWEKPVVQEVVSFCDTLGLSVFTLSGIRMAQDMGFSGNGYLLTFVGVITAVGGGVLRDLAIGRSPVIFRREVYATVSVAGAIAYLLLSSRLGDAIAGWLSVGGMCVFRGFSRREHLQLPVYIRKRKKKDGTLDQK